MFLQIGAVSYFRNAVLAPDNALLIPDMEAFAAIFAVALAIPICLLVAGGIRLYLFSRNSRDAVGEICAVQQRDWVDDEAMPVKRYFASIQYVVAGVAYTIPEWGPHGKAPAIGAAVAIRYRALDPGHAQVWLGRRWWWLLVPLMGFVAAEFIALKIWVGSV